MIQIVGTNHLMKAEEIEAIIKTFNPEVIGTEFCQARLNHYILNPPIQEGESKDKSILGKISSAIKKKAKEEGVVYGQDMITASRYALENRIPLCLLDKDVNEVRALMQTIPQSEQQGFMNELVKFESQTIKESTVDKQEFLINLKKDFPIAFEFLITMREMFIEKEILKTILKNPNKRILIFLGEGHLDNIKRNLGEFLR